MKRITKNTRQTCFICTTADKAMAEKIALGLAGYATFAIELGETENGPVTHHGLIVHSTDKFKIKLADVAQGKSPKSENGKWSDHKVKQADILPTVARMFISDVARGKDRAEHIDELAAENGLVRIKSAETLI